jgi:hypothetical protein
MNESRNVWALNGLTGGLIATALLLSILAVLTYFAMSVQTANSQNYYKIVNEKSIGSGIGFGEGHTTSKMSDFVVNAK